MKTQQQLNDEIDILIHHLQNTKRANALSEEAGPLPAFTLNAFNLN